MTEEESLIAAIQANPAEDTLRLVYADWLDEHDHPGGRYLQIEQQLTKCTLKSRKATAILRRGLRELRTQLNPRWLSLFDQPKLMRANPTPFRVMWSGIELSPYRPGRGTYTDYPYESLPPLPDVIPQGNWKWLSNPETPDQTQNIPSGTALGRLVERAATLGFTLPNEYCSLLTDAGAMNNVRSCTDCYFSLRDTISPCPRESGSYLIPFYHDSQDCRWWSLYVTQPSYHCVVVSPPFFEHRGRVSKPNPNQTFFCAPSFETFVYRWWIENEIWFRLVDPQFEFHDPRPLTVEMQAYLNHYQPQADG